MRIVIAGGTGFLGRPLANALAADGHRVVVLSRAAAAPTDLHPSPPGGTEVVPWQPDGRVGPWAAHLDGAGAVVNLAGESIAGSRWTRFGIALERLPVDPRDS